jgi:prevent-host-death family protein
MIKINKVREVGVAFKHFEFSASIGPQPEVPVKEAKAKLTELLRRVEAGERIVLTRHGKPVADLVPHKDEVEEKPMSLLERLEVWRKDNPPLGIGWVADDFDEPLPEDFLLQPLPDDFDEKLAEHSRRIREAKERRDAGR